MTRDEQHELDSIAKAVSVGTAGQYPPEAYPFLAEVAVTLATLGWQDGTCLMCPRPLRRHVCSCPHHQAKKRLQAFGVWPEGRQ